MARRYAAYDWYNTGSPLTPFIGIKFRGSESYLHIFPDKSNRIYVENATFNVLDNTGYSTASITLADPDFIHLERFFMKAMIMANSFSRTKNCWYCAAFWGWSYYGEGSGDSQRRTSGMHYYMLKDLNYNLDEVELRVTMELMDIGASAFGQGDDDKPDSPIGKLEGEGISREVTGAAQRDGEDLGQESDEWPNVDVGVEGSGGTKKVALEFNKEESSSSSTTEELTKPPPINNVINGKTRWEIIKAICAAQTPPFMAEAIDEPPEEEPVVDYVIPADAGLNESIDKLLKEMPKLENPGKHWGVLSGGNIRKTIMTIVFGWIPDTPTRGDTLTFDDKYRLARTFVYKPGYREEIAVGQTMINSLNYTWTSKGYWNLGIPKVFGIVKDTKGNLKVFHTEEDWKDYSTKAGDKVVKAPTTRSIDLLEAVDQLNGVEVEFNFNEGLETEEKLSSTTNRVIINVWNYFLKELVDMTIEIPGDPWLDNSLFSNSKDNRASNLLVDLYHAYFIINVYKPAVSRQCQLSRILSGKYLCIKGCSHSISEGDYTVSLNLMKSF